MKTLSREEIQRMTNSTGIGGISRSGGGGGGGGGTDLSGLATQLWVDDNYLSIEFFSSLFKAYAPAETTGDPDVEVTPNGGDTSTITNIKAMFGFWTEQYISALGQGSGGGGGGATALVDLVDVAISSPTDGQVLMYNATTNKWYNGTVQSGSSAWQDITGKPTTIAGYGITDAFISNGTITLGSNSITPLTSLPSHNHDTRYYISNGTIYLGGNSITPLTSSDLSGYATQNWVLQQGYVTSSGVTRVATGTGLTGGPITGSGTISINSTYQTYISNGNTAYGWGNHADVGYLTSSSNLNASKLTSGTVDFARLPTMYWADVAVSSTSDNNTSPQFGSVRLKPGSANYGGYLYFGDGSYAYICEPSDDNLQYKVGNNKTHIFTVGSTNRMEVNNSGLTVSGGLSITSFIDGATNIELKPSSSSAGNGGYIDFHYNQSSSDYTSRIIEDASGRLYLQATNGIRIGDCVITWDSTNNALKIQKTSGSANLYVTGGVTALA